MSRREWDCMRRLATARSLSIRSEMGVIAFVILVFHNCRVPDSFPVVEYERRQERSVLPPFLALMAMHHSNVAI